MTLLDRYRERRYDPSGAHFAPRRTWRGKLAVALPFAAALVLLVSFALASANSGVKQQAAFAPAAGVGYKSLLVPSGAIDASAGRARHAHGGRVQQQPIVMAGNGAAAREQQALSGGRSTGAAARRSHSAAPNQPTRSHPSYRTDARGYRIAPARDAAMVPTTTWLAHLEHSKRGYPSKDAFQSDRKVPGTWYGYPSILPVIDATAQRLHVRLAQRPDESTSWITRSGVVMSRTHWAILVDISQHWLYVFRNGVQTESYPVGTGARGTPTPTGTYFLAFHAPPNGPGYGSVMLETSAHSRVISHFEGGNDAIIAIHGPISSQSDAEIGNHGAAISNGCIRMHDRDLNQVKHVPDGAPVILTD